MQVQDRIAAPDQLAPDCREDALEEIRQCVLNGYLALGHGGLEVGGVLFGRVRAEGVRIEASQPFNSEYAFGPSLRLSAADEEALSQLIDQPAEHFAGMEPVGWYRSYTRSEPVITASEIAVLDRYFPECGRVLLLLKPTSHHNVSGSFYTRGAHGELNLEPVGDVFVLRPLLDFPKISEPVLEPEDSQVTPSPVTSSPLATFPVQQQASPKVIWPLLVSVTGVALVGMAALAMLVWPRIGPIEPIKIVVPPIAAEAAPPFVTQQQERNLELETLISDLTARNKRLEATLTILRRKSQPRAAAPKTRAASQKKGAARRRRR